MYSTRTKVTDTSFLILFCQTKSTLSSWLCSNRPTTKVASGRQLSSVPRTGFTGGGLWLSHYRNEEEEQSLPTLRPHPAPSVRGKFPPPPCCNAPGIAKTCCWKGGGPEGSSLHLRKGSERHIFDIFVLPGSLRFLSSAKKVAPELHG